MSDDSGGFRIASAFVKVGANDEGLKDEIEAKIKAASEGAAATVHIDADSAGLAAQVKAEAEAASADAHVNVNIDENGATIRQGLEHLADDAVPDADRAGSRLGQALGGGLFRDANGYIRNASGEFASEAEKLAAGLDGAGASADRAGRSAENAAGGFRAGAVGIGAMVAAGAELVPVLAAVPGLAAGVGGAVATLAAAFVPAIKTLHDFGAEQTATGQSGASLAAQQFSDAQAIRGAQQAITDARTQAARSAVTSAEQVANAEQSVLDTERSAASAATASADQVTAAQQRISDAAYTAQTAEQSYTNSLWSEQQAQASLAQARQEATNQLADSANSAADAHLAVEQATLNAAAAQRALTAANGNALLSADQKAAADLAARVSAQQLVDAKQRDLEATQKADSAQQAGVDHAPAVVSAQHAIELAAQATASAHHGVETALLGETDAQKGLAKAVDAAANQQITSDEQIGRAEQGLADAQRNADQQRTDSAQQLARAQQNLSDTITSQHLAAAAAAASGSAATSQYQKDLQGLTGAGKDFVFTAEGMRGELHQLSVVAQDATLPGFTSMLRDSNALLPDVSAGVHDMGTELGDTAAAFGHLFANPDFDKSAGEFEKIVTGGFGEFASALPPLLNAIVVDGDKAAPIINSVAVGVHDLIATGLPDFLSGLTVNATGAATGIGAVFRIVDDLLGPAATLAGAVSGALGPAFADLEPDVKALATDIVQDLVPVMPELSADLVDVVDIAHELLQIAEPLIPIITQDLAEGLRIVDPFLRDTAQFLHDNADWLTPVAEGILAVVAATKAWSLASDVGTGALGLLKKGATQFTADGKIAEVATKAWGVASSSTFRSLAAAVPVLGAVGLGAAALGQKLGEMSGVGDHTAQNLDHLTRSLSEAAQGSDAAQTDIDHLATGFAFMSDHLGGTVQGAKDLDTALAQLRATDPGAAATEFDKLSASLEAGGLSADKVAKLFPQYAAAADGAKDSTKAAAGAATDAQQPFSGLALHLDQVSQAGRNSTADLTKLDTALSNIDKRVSSQQALDEYTKALNGIRDGAAGSTKAISGNSQAAIDNRDQLDQAVTSLRHYYDSQVALHGPTDQVNADFQTQIDKLRDQAEKTYGSKKAVDDYLTSLGLVPESKTTKVDVSTADGVKTIKTWQTEIDALHGPHIDLTIEKVIGPGDVVLSIAGTRVKASTNARGGPVRAGEVSWVGEEGPELVEFGQAGTVIPNNRIRQVGPGDRPAAGNSTVNINYYGTMRPTPEQRALMYRDFALAVR